VNKFALGSSNPLVSLLTDPDAVELLFEDFQFFLLEQPTLLNKPSSK
jgi:hypothetical protein